VVHKPFVVCKVAEIMLDDPPLTKVVLFGVLTGRRACLRTGSSAVKHLQRLAAEEHITCCESFEDSLNSEWRGGCLELLS